MSSLLDTSTSSSTASGAVEMLNKLTREHVEILDEIIAQIPATSSGSITSVLKAYTDVMNSRGIDTEDDVVIYRFLLKLSMLKGPWHLNWQSVKANQSAIQPQPRADSPIKPRRLDMQLPGSPIASRGSTPIRVLGPASSSSTHRPTHPPAPQNARLQAFLDSRRPAFQASPRLQPRSGMDLNPNDVFKEVEGTRSADIFYQTVTLVRYFGIWRAGCEWLLTTGQQVEAAKNQLVLHRHMQSWRKHTARQLALLERAAQVHKFRCLTRTMHHWVKHLKHKRHNDWRQSMRLKLASIQAVRHRRLKQVAFSFWRLRAQELTAQRIYNLNLLKRAFSKWRANSGQARWLEFVADDWMRGKGQLLVLKAYTAWRRMQELSIERRRFEAWMDDRRVRKVLALWQRIAHARQFADALKARALALNTLTKWRKRLQDVRALTTVAANYALRREHALIRTVLKIWIAKERGPLLERVRETRTLRVALTTWRHNIAARRLAEEQALVFRNSSDRDTTLVRCFTVWRNRSHHIRTMLLFSAEYEAARLSMRIFGGWVTAFKKWQQTAAEARLIRLFFIQRRAWRTWRKHVAKRKEQKAIARCKQSRLRRWFELWRDALETRHHDRLCIETMEHRIAKRIMVNTLAYWTDRIIEIRERELVVAEGADKTCLGEAFRRWRRARERQLEDISLLVSFQDVKREDTLRRMFSIWFNAARSSQWRTANRAKMEDQVRIGILNEAFERWRGRLVEAQLSPLEDQFKAQQIASLFFRTFSIWQAKTSTLPAIRFFAKHSKQRAWNAWREAMPHALQAKEARKFEKRSLLNKFMERWLETYQRKKAVKSAMRARYLGQSSGQAPARPRMRRVTPPLPSPSPPPVLPSIISRRSSITSNVALPNLPPISIGPRLSFTGLSARSTPASLFSQPTTSTSSHGGGETASVAPVSRTSSAADLMRDTDKLWKTLRGERAARSARTHSDTRSESQQTHGA